MVQDPYKVLGVSQGASKEEIKKAYRQKAKENHPDLHPNDPAAAERMNEINEAYDMLNNPEKYQQKSQGTAYGNSYGGRNQGNTYGGYSGGYNRTGYGGYGQNGYGGYQQQNGGYGQGNPYGQGGYYTNMDFEDLFGFSRSANIPKPQRKPGDSPEIQQAVDFIQIGRYSLADQVLNQIPSDRRTARWHYLSAVANYSMGNMMLAMERIQRAVQMEPNNAEYQQVAQMMQQAGAAYQEQSNAASRMARGMGIFCIGFFLLQMFCMFCRF